MGKIKNFDIPRTITVEEYTALGKLVHKFQTDESFSSRQLLIDFINGILITTALSRSADPEGVYDNDKSELTGKGAYAYSEGKKEAKSDNRLGGSKSEYEKQNTAYTTNYKPTDPRKDPNPYNSVWDIFNN